MTAPLPTRRHLLSGASAGAAAATLAGCGGEEAAAPGAEGGTSGSGGESGTRLITLSEVPVGRASPWTGRADR